VVRLKDHRIRQMTLDGTPRAQNTPQIAHIATSHSSSCLACRINGCWCNFCCALVDFVVENGGRDGRISSVQVPGCLRQNSSPSAYATHRSMRA
jgi:hypothetical protein